MELRRHSLFHTPLDCGSSCYSFLNRQGPRGFVMALRPLAWPRQRVYLNGYPAIRLGLLLELPVGRAFGQGWKQWSFHL